MKLDRSHVVGIVVGLAATAFCAYGGWWLGRFDRAVCGHLEQMPALIEKIGSVDHCVQQTIQTGGITDLDSFVYGVRGPKGMGSAWIRTSQRDGTFIVDDVMLTLNGQEYVLQGVRPPTR